MSQVSDNQIGRRIAGYRLTAILGVGGMAKVYRAQDDELGREVALKLLSGEQAGDIDYVRRFRSEARKVAALTHPNIVPVYQFGEDQGVLFLVMPIMAESLRQRLERESILPLALVVPIVIQIASALQSAHGQGIVHRDVKPENILLDGTGSAFLTDFGIAREEDILRRKGAKRTLSPTGLPVGTPEYMAPEQLQAAIVDHRADVYALGSVLYELLAGVTPHDASTPYAVAVRVLTEPLIPPSQHNPAIPPEVEQVVLRALALRPEDRYSDMASLIEALASASAPFLEGQPGSLRTYANLRELRSAPTEPAKPWRRWTSAGLGKLGNQKSLLQLVATAVVILAMLTGTGLLLARLGQALPHHIGLEGTSTTGSHTPVPSGGLTSSEQTATANAGVLPSPSAGLGTPGSALELQLSPASQITLSKQGHTCTGHQTIRNDGPLAISWQWTATSPQISGLQFQTTGSGWSSGLPSGMVAANSSTTLSVRLNCSGGQSDAITMADDQGNRYRFSLVV